MINKFKIVWNAYLGDQMRIKLIYFTINQIFLSFY